MVRFQNFEVTLRGQDGNNLPEYIISERDRETQVYVEATANTTYSLFLSIPKSNTLSLRHSIIFDLYIDGRPLLAPIARKAELLRDHNDGSPPLPNSTPITNPNNQWERIVDGALTGNYKDGDQQLQRFNFGALNIDADQVLPEKPYQTSKDYHYDLGLIEVVVREYDETGTTVNDVTKIDQGIRTISEKQIKGQALDMSTIFEEPMKVSIPERIRLTGKRVGAPALQRVQFKYRSKAALNAMLVYQDDEMEESEDRGDEAGVVKKEDGGTVKPDKLRVKRRMSEESTERLENRGAGGETEIKRIKRETDEG